MKDIFTSSPVLCLKKYGVRMCCVHAQVHTRYSVIGTSSVSVKSSLSPDEGCRGTGAS
ncbi:hypothetical protein NOR_03335 [Metarhizium rileyi]|uniref:Uncharacterized protein n=1 Tax=Metarhizium rileyi (strain RCEF 4871) TaxID=1649241 RepID=A0A167FP03_METRR|nr:hypothetical protein NOR_03335 [Metarhizium rileyi RCEF 4871]